MDNRKSSAFYSGATRYGGSSAIALRREAARKAFFKIKPASTTLTTTTTVTTTNTSTTANSMNVTGTNLFSTNTNNVVRSYTLNDNDIIRREATSSPQLTSAAKRILNWIEQNSASHPDTIQLNKRKRTKYRFNPMSYRAPVQARELKPIDNSVTALNAEASKFSAQSAPPPLNHYQLKWDTPPKLNKPQAPVIDKLPEVQPSSSKIFKSPESGEPIKGNQFTSPGEPRGFAELMKNAPSPPAHKYQQPRQPSQSKRKAPDDSFDHVSKSQKVPKPRQASPVEPPFSTKFKPPLSHEPTKGAPILSSGKPKQFAEPNNRSPPSPAQREKEQIKQKQQQLLIQQQQQIQLKQEQELKNKQQQLQQLQHQQQLEQQQRQREQELHQEQQKQLQVRLQQQQQPVQPKRKAPDDFTDHTLKPYNPPKPTQVSSVQPPLSTKFKPPLSYEPINRIQITTTGTPKQFAEPTNRSPIPPQEKEHQKQKEQPNQQELEQQQKKQQDELQRQQQLQQQQQEEQLRLQQKQQDKLQNDVEMDIDAEPTPTSTSTAPPVAPATPAPSNTSAPPISISAIPTPTQAPTPASVIATSQATQPLFMMPTPAFPTQTLAPSVSTPSFMSPTLIPGVPTTSFTGPGLQSLIPTPTTQAPLVNGNNCFAPPPTSSVRGRKYLRPLRRLQR